MTTLKELLELLDPNMEVDVSSVGGATGRFIGYDTAYNLRYVVGGKVSEHFNCKVQYIGIEKDRYDGNVWFDVLIDKRRD